MDTRDHTTRRHVIGTNRSSRDVLFVHPASSALSMLQLFYDAHNHFRRKALLISSVSLITPAVGIVANLITKLLPSDVIRWTVPAFEPLADRLIPRLRGRVRCFRVLLLV